MCCIYICYMARQPTRPTVQSINLLSVHFTRQRFAYSGTLHSESNLWTDHNNNAMSAVLQCIIQGWVSVVYTNLPKRYITLLYVLYRSNILALTRTGHEQNVLYYVCINWQALSNLNMSLLQPYGTVPSMYVVPNQSMTTMYASWKGNIYIQCHVHVM